MIELRKTLRLNGERTTPMANEIVGGAWSPPPEPAPVDIRPGAFRNERPRKPTLRSAGNSERQCGSRCVRSRAPCCSPRFRCSSRTPSLGHVQSSRSPSLPRRRHPLAALGGKLVFHDPKMQPEGAAFLAAPTASSRSRRPSWIPSRYRCHSSRCRRPTRAPSPSPLTRSTDGRGAAVRSRRRSGS